MIVIIHDLGSDYESILKDKCDTLINADGKYVSCQGCFECWTKHPAECRIKDDLKEICRVIGRADELIIITENCYGSYSPAVKNILDRSIGTSTPMSTYRGRQMHHTLRYGKHNIIKVYAYGDISDREKETLKLMAERNSINDGYENSEVIFLENIHELVKKL